MSSPTAERSRPRGPASRSWERPPTDLDRLLDARTAKGLSTDGVWTGTAVELRAFVAALGEAGATWFVVLPAGPADRLDVIADALIA